MKRSHKIASWIAGVLIALIVLLVLVVALFNWNRLKPFIDSKVSQAIGRPFAINGDLSVAWRREPDAGGLASVLPWPEFTARDIRITNPSWAKQREFAHLDALRFRLSPLALLAHRIRVPSLRMVNPAIDLERDKSGRATWDFDIAQSDTPSAWTLDLGAIGFASGTLDLDDAASRIKLKLTVKPLQKAIPYDQLIAQQSDQANAQAGKSAGAAARKAVAKGDKAKGDENQPAPSKTPYQFAWTVDGSYKGVPASGSGHIGAVLALQQSNRPFPVQAKMRIGDSHIALVGTLTDPVNLGALDLKLWFSGSSMAKLYPIIGVTLPDTPSYATEGHLKAQFRGKQTHFSYEHFHGRVGGSDLSGSLDYTGGGARPKLSGTITSKVLQFGDLAPLIGADSNAEKKQRGDGTLQPADKVLPVEPFRTDRWKAMDADVKYKALHIEHAPGVPIQSLSTHLVMNDGVLSLDPLNFTLAGGKVTSHIHLDGSKTPMSGKVRMSARHLKLKQLFPTFEPMKTSFGEINGDTDLDVRGNSIATLLGNANGELKLLMNDGAISKTLLEEAGLNVGNIILAKLFGDKTVKINCAATDFVAKDGLFRSRLFVFDTTDATIDVSGGADMASEKLDLEIKPHTKGFRILSLRTPLYVKGTFKDPSVGVKPGPLILRGGGAVALAVVAAPAAALLALVAPSHDNEGENTCRRVLQEMNKPTRANAGHSPIQPAKEPAH